MASMDELFAQSKKRARELDRGEGRIKQSTAVTAVSTQAQAAGTVQQRLARMAQSGQASESYIRQVKPARQKYEGYKRALDAAQRQEEAYTYKPVRGSFTGGGSLGGKRGSRDRATVTAELVEKRGEQQAEAAGLGPITGGWGDPETVKRLQAQSDKAREIKPLFAELVELDKAEEQALIDSGEYRPAGIWDATVGSIKQGYYNSRYGQESWKKARGEENEADKYQELLAGEEFKFIPQGLPAKAVSGAAQLVGQWGRQATDPNAVAMGVSAAGLAAAAGQAGPQVLVPEEIVTVPGAFAAGLATGSAKANMEIEAGLAYNEMLENGISHDTAYKIAQGVGGINGLIEMVQLDELIKGFKVLSKSGATEGLARKLGRVLLDKGIDIAQEVAQETAQESVTIGGVQAANRMEKGEWAYDFDQVWDRLGETAASSALTFGAASIPGTVRNVVHMNDVPGRHVSQAGDIKSLSLEKTTGLTPISPKMRESLSTGKNNIIAQTLGDIVSFANQALEKKGGPERLYMGTIPDATAAMIKSATGVDVTGYNAVLPGDSVQHIFKKHGDSKTETLRGQRAVTANDIALIPQVMAAPDSVALSGETDARGRIVILFSKKIGDTFATAQAVSDGRKTLSTDTLWIKKEGPTDTGYNVDKTVNPVHNAQGVPSSEPSSDIVSQTIDGVKGQEVQQPEGSSGIQEKTSAVGLPAEQKNKLSLAIFTGAGEQQIGAILKGFGPEAVQAVINEGLQHSPDSDSGSRARRLREKLNAGQEPTGAELARLYQANEQAARTAAAQQSTALQSTAVEGGVTASQESVGLTTQQRGTLEKLRQEGRTFKQVGMALQKMGPEATRAVIAEGLRTTPGSDSYNRARTLQRKLSTGESITASELGHLYDALRRDQAQGGSASKQLAESTRKDGTALTEDEKGAILAYKSSESYKINAILRDGDPMDGQTRQFVDSLDSALTKLPIYRGTVYRNISFDDFGGKADMDAFLSQFAIGKPMIMDAYTSTSKSVDGHLVDGEHVVNMETESTMGRELAGFGNNSEKEILLRRGAVLLPIEMTVGEDGRPLIKLIEVEGF